MTFKPRGFKNPQLQKKTPTERVGKWNPPVKENPIPVRNAVIEDNYVSSVNDPLRKITRKPRG